MSEEQEARQRGQRRTAAEIQQIVSEFKSSGLTQIEFSRRQGLTLSTLGRYLSRLRPSSEAGGDGLVAVEVAVKKYDPVYASGCGLSVVVAGGRRIVLESGFDAASLQRAVRVLEKM